MGDGDFHVPFPVMPCLFRWPANWAGGSQKRRKKGGKTVSVKNPYVKGMKTIVAEDDGPGYQGEALLTFREIADDPDTVWTGVLNYSRKLKLAWLVDGDGIMHFYKPMQRWGAQMYEPIPGSEWKIYHTRLGRAGDIELVDVSQKKYRKEEDALSDIWREAQSHAKSLEEHLAKLNEATFSPRDIMNWEAHGRDPRYFPGARGPEVNAFALQNELKRRFPHQFEDVEISDRTGRWAVVFTTPLPDGQREIKGQQRVEVVLPQVNRMISFLRTRGVEVNGYDVSAVAP